MQTRNHFMARFIIGIYLVSAGACDVGDPCALAQQHLGECGFPNALAAGTCDAEAKLAGELIALDCGQVQALFDQAKGDWPGSGLLAAVSLRSENGDRCLFNFNCAEGLTCLPDWFGYDGFGPDHHVCAPPPNEETIHDALAVPFCDDDSDCESGHICRVTYEGIYYGTCYRAK